MKYEDFEKLSYTEVEGFLEDQAVHYDNHEIYIIIGEFRQMEGISIDKLSIDSSILLEEILDNLEEQE